MTAWRFGRSTRMDRGITDGGWDRDSCARNGSRDGLIFQFRTRRDRDVLPLVVRSGSGFLLRLHLTSPLFISTLLRVQSARPRGDTHVSEELVLQR